MRIQGRVFPGARIFAFKVFWFALLVPFALVALDILFSIAFALVFKPALSSNPDQVPRLPPFTGAIKHILTGIALVLVVGYKAVWYWYVSLAIQYYSKYDGKVNANVIH